MPQLVLGHHLGPAADVPDNRLAFDAEQGRQLLNCHPAEYLVSLIEHVRPEGAAQERPEQDRALGTAAGKLDAREAAREDVPVLDPGYDKAKAVKGMGDLVLAVTQRDDRARGRAD